MIQDGNRLSPENEAKLGSYLLEVHDCVNRQRCLYKFFKFSVCQLIEILKTEPDAYDNLDTLLYLFFKDNEMLLDEIETKIQQSRELMQSIRNSQN